MRTERYAGQKSPNAGGALSSVDQVQRKAAALLLHKSAAATDMLRWDSTRLAIFFVGVKKHLQAGRSLN